MMSDESKRISKTAYTRGRQDAAMNKPYNNPFHVKSPGHVAYEEGFDGGQPQAVITVTEPIEQSLPISMIAAVPVVTFMLVFIFLASVFDKWGVVLDFISRLWS